MQAFAPTQSTTRVPLTHRNLALTNRLNNKGNFQVVLSSQLFLRVMRHSIDTIQRQATRKRIYQQTLWLRYLRRFCISTIIRFSRMGFPRVLRCSVVRYWRRIVNATSCSSRRSCDPVSNVHPGTYDQADKTRHYEKKHQVWTKISAKLEQKDKETFIVYISLIYALINKQDLMITVCN